MKHTQVAWHGLLAHRQPLHTTLTFSWGQKTAKSSDLSLGKPWIGEFGKRKKNLKKRARVMNSLQHQGTIRKHN